MNKPRGTIYWGGGGLNGSYIQDQVLAFQEAGVQHIWIADLLFPVSYKV